ncbi:hypothetical protein OAK38_01475 [Verrucomicrobia bacterium]|nr:hypothetical protein [Verrucomicrobiota bacterium]
MAGLFSSVQFLTTHMGNESLRSANSIKQVAASGDPVKQASMQGQGAGDVSFAANLLNRNASKRSSINAFQNAVTHMQAQADGLRQAEKIYQRMLDLASLAVDPMLNDNDRALLSQEFESLRTMAVEINSQTIGGANLFDMRAATTKYQVDFLEGTTQDPATKSGKINGNDYWDITKDVIYNSGKITVDHRPMSAWDRVTIFQSDPTKPLFDTGEWTTSGSDFDRFIIRYGPDRDTTFQFVPQDTNGNNIYANKNRYLAHLGLADDGTPSGWDTRTETEFKNLGLITTNSSDSTTSELTVRIEATGSVFDIEANWEPLEIDDAFVGRSQDLQLGLNPLGLGALRTQDSGFPKIAIDTRQNAQSAIDLIRDEINGFTQQIGNLSSNMSRVENSMEATQQQIATQEQALSGVVREDLALQMLKVTKARIARSQNAAMLSQAINLNYDIANMIL